MSEDTLTILQRKDNMVVDMRAKGFVRFEVSLYGNAGDAFAMVFHRVEFVRMLAIELDEIMNRHNAYCLGYGDKLFVVFK